jgi:hypothetical protein
MDTVEVPHKKLESIETAKTSLKKQKFECMLNTMYNKLVLN